MRALKNLVFAVFCAGFVAQTGLAGQNNRSIQNDRTAQTGLAAKSSRPDVSLGDLREGFAAPPDSVRPGVYWYFMDGNLSSEGMTADLEAMKEAGIGSVLFLEVNVGVPRGKVDFLSPEWKRLFRHAVDECERLGIAMTLGIGPGWTGSGGPWVKGEESMQHLVASLTDVTGGSRQTIALPRPQPRSPFFGEGGFTPELRDRWLDYYTDITVIAFPRREGAFRIEFPDEKALYYKPPFSSDPSAKQFLPRQSAVADAASCIDPATVIDLGALLQADGTLTWDVPEGEWTVMRVGATNNGAVTRPAPLPGVGFECDKADSLALKAHFEVFTDELFRAIGPRDPEATGGLRFLHMDSWEMGAQNWTPRLREEFTRRRGYDPQPFYPAYLGYAVGSVDLTERFLWDLRQTFQELMLEQHVDAVRRYAHDRRLRLSIEPYDMNPMQDLELAARADIPMCEFWTVDPMNFNTSFSAVEGSSAANLIGQRVVPSEAFTHNGDAWRQHPASMKNQTDWALAAGINKLYFHTFAHQCLPDSLRPGMTMGPYGVHWDRGQTWWPYIRPFHDYIARCQYMLQNGRTVADILYLAPEEAPFAFKSPASALDGDWLPDRRGHNFDACPASLLMQAECRDGLIVFPGGASYRLLVLPCFPAMTVGLLEKIATLVADGATVLGMPPAQTPGLAGYPQTDARLASLAADLWGGTDAPAGLQSRPYGKGRIWWGDTIPATVDNLYPDYAAACTVLADAGVPDDFADNSGSIRYIHKLTDDGAHCYFLANRTACPVATLARFRASGRHIQLWDPVDGTARTLTGARTADSLTEIPLHFEPEQSYFIIIADIEPATAPALAVGTPVKTPLAPLDGDWTVRFDPAWGGPAQPVTAPLFDWSTADSDSIRYYSGTAVYTRTFTLDKRTCTDLRRHKADLLLSLGTVANIARVWVNGIDLGVVWSRPWELDITRAVRPGANTLRIEVANAWTNRLIGDERLPDDGIADGRWPAWLLDGTPRPGSRLTFTTHRHYTPASPLIPSGLLGPASLLLRTAK